MPPTMFRIVAAAALLASGSGLTGAMAADLEVTVRGAGGQPVRDAVVSLHLAARPTPAPRPIGGIAIDQQDIQFHPFVTVVPVGTRISFMNHDATRHHVYSFSPAKHFELKLEQRQQNRDVTFDKAGIVPLGCNIHDKMIAFVDVVDTPWAILTGADGRAVFRGLPAGAMIVSLWHPYLKAPGNRIDRTLPLVDDIPRREVFVAPLRAPPRPPAITDY